MKAEEEIKRWTANRKSALVLDIIQGKTTVAGASRANDRAPSEVENGVDDAQRGMENALRAKPKDVREQYERHLSKTRGMASCTRRSGSFSSLSPAFTKRTEAATISSPRRAFLWRPDSERCLSRSSSYSFEAALQAEQ